MMLRAEQIRFNMVEQQVRPWDVLDQKVLDLMGNTAREAFAPTEYMKLAYADTEIPLGHGEQMLAPKIVGRLLQALDLDPSDKALEIGTGSGYVTALLAKACHHVYSVDIQPEFIETAGAKLAKQGLTNVTLETGDAAQGWDKHQPYDVTLITGSLPELPEAFKQTMQRGGRLAAIVGKGPIMEAVLITRTADNEWTREVLFETEIPALKNTISKNVFIF